MSYSKALDRMMGLIMARLPGALDDIVKEEFFVVLNTFFKDSNVWRETIFIDTEVGEVEYEIFPNEDAQIHRLFGVFNSMDRLIGARMGVPGVVVLDQIPSSPERVKAIVSLTVTELTTINGFPLIPDWIIDRWWDEFVDGVLSRMMSQKSKPYTDNVLAVFHGRKFRNSIAEARVEANRKYMFSVQAWRFPNF